MISAFAGTYGAPIKYEDVWVFPSDNWGVTQTPYYAEEFKADIVISHQDLWTLEENYGTKVDWYPWFPIDHQPPPPKVMKRVKYAKTPMVQSKFAVSELKKLGYEPYYVPAGVDTNIYKPGGKIDNFGDNFVIGLVGSNRGPRKNLQQVIEAFKIFHDRHKDSVLYMHTNVADVGAGVNLRNIVDALGLIGTVFFPKQLDYYISLSFEEMAELYNSFDVFLLPSAGEGFGVPIIEAEACGTPVIVSDFTAMPELVGGGWTLKKLQKIWTYQDSWQVTPDLEEIVECLEQAYQEKKDGSIVKRKEEARKKAMEYDWDNLSPMWDEIIQGIEKQPKGRSWEGVQPERLMLIPNKVTPEKVLDIGCGKTAPYKEHLEKLGEYTGIDKTGGKGVVKADACNLPFKDRAFGFVWCSELFEHLDTPQLALNEAKRVGRHGVVIFPTPVTSWFGKDVSHKEVKLNEKFFVNHDGHGIIMW